MKTIKFFILILFISSATYAQTKISGTVKDSEGNSLPGANIYIKDSYDGVSSDEDGSYNFITYEEGEAVLVASFIGFKQFEQQVNLTGEELKIDIAFESEAKELGTIVVSAGSFEASDEKKAVILKPLDIITTGAEADIYSALETLPGTQQIGEADGLFVRGGSAAETKTIIDEMVVQNPFYTSVPDIPSRGRFSPFLFKGTVFSTGGYSAKYGQALSSVLVLKTQDLAPKTLTALNLMILGWGAAHTHRWENTSFAIEGGYYNLGPYFDIQKQRVDWQEAPESFDGSFNMRHKTSETGMLKFFSSYSNGYSSLNVPDLDNNEQPQFIGIKSTNALANINYKEILGEDWTLFSGYAFSTDRDRFRIAADDIFEEEILHAGRVHISKNIFNKSFITFGGEVNKINYEDSFNGMKLNLEEFFTAGFVESDLIITNDMAARIGVRGEYSDAIAKSNIAPRLSLAYRLGEFDQLNFAYGLFYQTPHKDYLIQTTDLGFEKATHYIFNYQYLGLNRTFRIEFYYKEYDDLAKGTVFTPPYFNLPDVPFSNNGGGYAKGIDIFWRDKETFDLTDYWISYSFIDTKRDFRNYPKLAFPTFATPHTFSVVVKHWVPAVTANIGLTYTYATGRPYFNPNNPEFLDDRAKDYHNLSMNVSYLTSVFDNFTVIFFSVDNVLGYNHIYGYRYSSDGNIRRPILSPALRSAFIGMFISLGESNPY